MKNKPQLMVMLTHHDETVKNAYEIFERCKDAKAKLWGMKEEPLALEEMKKLYAYMKQCGKITALEVVAYTEEECLKGAQMAVECNCDILMGTLYFDSINDICKKQGIKYMPFVGKVTGRPSILKGTIEEMVEETKRYQEKGIYGVDLLGYRYVGEQHKLNCEFVAQTDISVCIAGSVDGYEKIDEVIETGAEMFTIGGAFFDGVFGDDIAQQINKVCQYIDEKTSDELL